ncbi:glycosyltransferase involved in cell wall biosynthesis [Roseibium hamelinense]|uniref:Glycosyltransferase involved in cell wall biosynthesis n=2 Tax=Roseibium hamelinense TaxID=150831 RepID=A0A562T1P9_9HYPH|nr:glycosyltransferase [Roseibium hamelinense]MTI43837.1 glycosyltransferase [Roseibium hamelinense]TWI87078.1 glycosyltransferase involved in cell wall biosynthesis [Roseibium hamelinense]
MRILLPCAAFPPFADGGGPISSLMIAQILRKEGHDLRVVNISGEDRHEEYHGLNVHRLPSQNIYWNYREPHPAWQKIVWHALENGNPRAFTTMRNEIRDFQPDIVLSLSIENINVATWAAAKSLSVPVAHTVFSAFMMCWNGVMQRNGQTCTRQCADCKLTSIGRRFFSRYVDGLIGESEDTIARHLGEGYFPNARPRRIPAAIDKVHAHVPRPYPNGRPLRIGFLGVHTHFKGVGTLGEAANMMGSALDIEFVIAGEGNDAFARSLPGLFPAHRTNFVGWVKPNTFLSEIDLLVYPSLGREAFGRASIEAFSHAVPVISTDIGGVAENIKQGVNGFHFEAGNALSLKAAIEQAVSDPKVYEHLSEGALASAWHYTPAAVGRQFSEFLSELAAPTRTPSLHQGTGAQMP